MGWKERVGVVKKVESSSTWSPPAPPVPVEGRDWRFEAILFLWVGGATFIFNVYYWGK